VLIPAAGGAVATVTDSTHTNQSPAWSPDSRLLFFVSNRHGARDIYAAGVSSSGRVDDTPMRLTTGLNAQSIGLSADGKRLAYSVYTAQANIWSLPVPSAPPVSATGATQITSGSQVIEGLRVSPDLKWLLYDSNLHGTSNLYRVAIAGGTPERLTTDSVDDFQPVLSPDGTELAYHAVRGTARQILILPLNGGAVTQVAPTNTDQRVADWAPNGKALVWYDRATSAAWVAHRSADGKWQPPVLRAVGFIHPKWSPDGRMLIGATPNGAIVVSPADSGPARIIYAPRPLSTDPLAEWPTWAGDGRAVWFKSHDAEGRASIWSILATGGIPRLLVRFDDVTRPSYRVEWATDGKRLYFAINDRQSDIWVVELSKK
jgi:TolB protein